MIDDDASLELVFDELSFPTSLVIDDDGSFYIAESGRGFGEASPGGRIWRFASSGDRALLARDLRAPVNGVALHDDRLHVSEGGNPGRISRFDLNGSSPQVILDNLPGHGNYHTNMVV